MNINAFAKSLLTVMLVLVLYGCSGSPKSATSASYTIGGTVTGLTGSGLALQDNGGASLVISVSGIFTFATTVTSGGTYSVTVVAQPSNPAQTCTVANGSGTATANVTTVAVTCVAGS